MMQVDAFAAGGLDFGQAGFTSIVINVGNNEFGAFIG